MIRGTNARIRGDFRVPLGLRPTAADRVVMSSSSIVSPRVANLPVFFDVDVRGRREVAGVARPRAVEAAHRVDDAVAARLHEGLGRQISGIKQDSSNIPGRSARPCGGSRARRPR